MTKSVLAKKKEEKEKQEKKNETKRQSDNHQFRQFINFLHLIDCV